jgi:predicted N-acetyltransferase YhbS
MRLIAEQPDHIPAIEALLDQAFGPDRHTKTVYRLRQGVEPVHALSLVAVRGGALEGTIRYWPVRIADRVPALLLGPVAVAAHRRSDGLGGVLIRRSLETAARLGHRIVLLVGDAPYYTRFGFRRDLAEPLALPGPVDLARFLALELVPGALAGVGGMVGPPAQAERT